MPVKSNLSEMEIFWILKNPKNESLTDLAKRIKTSKEIIKKVIDDNTVTEYKTEIKPKNPQAEANKEKFAKDKKYGFVGMTQVASEIGDYGNPSGSQRKPAKTQPDYIFQMNKEEPEEKAEQK